MLPSVYFGTPFCDRQNKNLRFLRAAIDLPFVRQFFFFIDSIAVSYVGSFEDPLPNTGEISKTRGGQCQGAFCVPRRELWWMLRRRHPKRKIAGSPLKRKLHARMFVSSLCFWYCQWWFVCVCVFGRVFELVFRGRLGDSLRSTLRKIGSLNV